MAATHAHVDRHLRLLPPTRSTSRSCSTRSSLACSAQRQLADLVEEQGAAVGLLEERRARRRVAPVKAPFSWPNSSLSSSVSGMRGAVDGDERAARRARRCRGAARATSSLPVPVSPVMSTVRVDGGDALDQPYTSRMAALVPRIPRSPVGVLSVRGSRRTFCSR